MKISVIISKLSILFAIFAYYRTDAQYICQNADLLPAYEFAGQQMGPSFTTVGIFNDNNSAGAPFCVTSLGTGGQRWFKLNLPNTAPISVSITTNNPATNFDTKLHVFTGSCGALTCVTANDDGGVGTTSLVTFTAQPGVEYLIRVGGYMAAEGTTAINMTAGGGSPGCQDPSAINYSPEAVWDDDSCCYASGHMTLSPIGGSIQLLADGVVVATAEATGLPVNFCIPWSCNYQIQYVPFPFGNGCLFYEGQYEVTINGITTTGNIYPDCFFAPKPVFGPFCGCLDPQATNYLPSGTFDLGNCFYQQNINCSAAQLIEPGFNATISTAGMTGQGQNAPTACHLVNGHYALWYKFVYQGGTIQINSGSQLHDTFLGVFQSCDGLALACVDDLIVDNQLLMGASHTFTCGEGLIFGETYYIAVGLLGTGSFPFSFNQYNDTSCCSEIGTMSLSQMEGQLFLYENGSPIAVVSGGSTSSFCVTPTCNYFLAYSPNTYDPNCIPMQGTYEVTIGGETITGNINSVCSFQSQALPSPFCGCMDSNALNYSPTAIQDLGNCIYPPNSNCANAQLIEPGFNQIVNTTGVSGMTNNSMCQNVAIGDKRLWYKFVYEGGIIEISTGNGFIDTVLGVFDECDGTVIACVDDVYSDSNGVTLSASQTFDCNSGLVHGQTYYIAIGYADGQGSFAFSLNSIPVSGCTSPCSSNYNPCASVDDGSCAPVPGCTFACSENYNPCASVDDGSCIYPDIPGGGNNIFGPGDFNGDNIVNFADLAIFLSLYGMVYP